MIRIFSSRYVMLPLVGNVKKVYCVESGATLTLVLVARESTEAQVQVALVGERAQALILGFIKGKRDDTIRLHTLQHHKARETTSNLLIKAVLRDAAVCTYDGAIRVDPKAQKTDAYQRNENLLLSGSSHAESKPSLEILADDVRCTHGAVVATIPEDQLWYLASRGISGTEARKLIVDGFWEHGIMQVPGETTQNSLRSMLVL